MAAFQGNLRERCDLFKIKISSKIAKRTFFVSITMLKDVTEIVTGILIL